VSKSQFAKIINVHRSRISHHIADGKIDGAAIVGTGRKSLIDVDVAIRQLQLRLDDNQMCGLNGLSTNLSPPKPPVPTISVSELAERVEEALEGYAAGLKRERLGVSIDILRAEFARVQDCVALASCG